MKLSKCPSSTEPQYLRVNMNNSSLKRVPESADKLPHACGLNRHLDLLPATENTSHKPATLCNLQFEVCIF